MSRPPNTRSVSAAACSASGILEMSQVTKAAFPSRFSVSAPAWASVSAIITRAPSSTKRKAIPAPMPRAAPMMRATRLSSLPFMRASVSPRASDHQEAVDDANRRTDAKRDHQRDRQDQPLGREGDAKAGAARAEQDAGDHRGQAGNRFDREIRVSGNDDDGEADRHDADKGRLLDDVYEDPGLKEIRNDTKARRESARHRERRRTAQHGGL